MALKFSGTCVIRMDGLSLAAKEKAKIEIGGKERTAVVADHDVQGYTEKPVPAKVSATIAHTASSDLIAIANATNVTIDFETDTGVTYTVAGAWCSKPPELTGGEGDCDVEFMGRAAVQR